MTIIVSLPRSKFGSASRGYLVVQNLEEVLLQAWEDSNGRVVARREVRSFATTGPIDSEGNAPSPYPYIG
jgi:hypothetical protein